MEHHDILSQLRAADPASRVDLGRVDPEALTALREAITVTAASPEPERSAVKRFSRRSLTVVAAVVAVLGGGVAYAGVEQGWYVGGGGSDGITCVTRWADLDQGASTGGPALTGDPVADCQEYQALSGLPAIEDGVAFRYGSPQIYVAPRDQVPPDASLLTPDPEDGPEFELWQSVNDYVDGLGARCLSADEAVTAARDELDRLGLTDWSVQTQQRSADRPAQPCARFVLDDPVMGPTGDYPVDPQTLVVVPEARGDKDSLNGDGVEPFVFEVRDALRAGIADTCVDLATARAVAVEAIGTAHHWPITAIVDEDAACTRADLLGGGSILITLRGPEGVAP